uniref:Uncharacterized protein n=1 Tax=Amphimedon queenslandica TaxID=400682 RepID=A0A1X7SHN3_AMPQE
DQAEVKMKYQVECYSRLKLEIYILVPNLSQDVHVSVISSVKVTTFVIKNKNDYEDYTNCNP